MARLATDFKLTMAAFAPATRVKYLRAVKDFEAWMRENNEVAFSLRELDLVLTDYFQFIFDDREGRGRSVAEATLSGINAFLRPPPGSFTFAPLALRGWRRLVPSTPYPPITRDLCVLVAVDMWRRRRHLMAVGVLLSFDCLLRVGELVGLLREDAADHDDPRLGVTNSARTFSLRLRHTKTGPNKWTMVSDPAVVHLLRFVYDTTEPKKPLFPFSAAQLRSAFHESVESLGLSRTYVLHSLRHGGASHLYLSGMSIENVLERGRWASTKSARHYIQASRSLLLAVDVPPARARTARTLATDILRSLSLAQPYK